MSEDHDITEVRQKDEDEQVKDVAAEAAAAAAAATVAEDNGTLAGGMTFKNTVDTIIFTDACNVFFFFDIQKQVP